MRVSNWWQNVHFWVNYLFLLFKENWTIDCVKLFETKPKTNAETNEDTDVVNTVFEPLKLL